MDVDTNNHNILVEAKNEYMSQLCTIMLPVMVMVFEEIYKEAHTMAKGKKVLIQFQKLLKEVSNWNTNMVNQNAERICNSCSWFSDLLAALFVSYVKILSTIRLTNQTKKISLKLPSNQVFIHACYINASKDLYKDPYIYHEEDNEYERDDKLYKRFVVCIENTIKELLPIQQILQTYVSKESLENSDLSEPIQEDSEDPDLTPDDEPLMGDEDEEPTEEPMEEPTEEPKPELPLGAEADPETVETKDINVSKPPPGSIMNTGDDDDGVLFKNAPN